MAKKKVVVASVVMRLFLCQVGQDLVRTFVIQLPVLGSIFTT